MKLLIFLNFCALVTAITPAFSQLNPAFLASLEQIAKHRANIASSRAYTSDSAEKIPLESRPLVRRGESETNKPESPPNDQSKSEGPDAPVILESGEGIPDTEAQSEAEEFTSWPVDEEGRPLPPFVAPSTPHILFDPYNEKQILLASDVGDIIAQVTILNESQRDIYRKKSALIELMSWSFLPAADESEQPVAESQASSESPPVN